MVRSCQSQGWPIAALLSGLLIFGGCEEFRGANGGQPQPVDSGYVKEGGPGAEAEPMVQFSVYINGEPVDTVSVPQSLLDTQSNASSDGEEEAESAQDATETDSDVSVDDTEL